MKTFLTKLAGGSVRADTTGEPRFRLAQVGVLLKGTDRQLLTLAAGVWVGALLLGLLASFSSWRASRLHQEASVLAAEEMPLPRAVKGAVDPAVLKALAERTRALYPTLEIQQLEQSIVVKAPRADGFADWVSAVTYFDAASPNLRWSVTRLCVGEGCNDGAMTATVVPEGLSITFPNQTGK